MQNLGRSVCFNPNCVQTSNSATFYIAHHYFNSITPARFYAKICRHKLFLFVSQTSWIPSLLAQYVAVIVCTETQCEGTTSVKDYYQWPCHTGVQACKRVRREVYCATHWYKIVVQCSIMQGRLEWRVKTENMLTTKEIEID